MRAGFCASPIRPSNFVTSCASQSPSKPAPFAHADAPVREHRDREGRLRGRDPELVALHRVDRQAVQRSTTRSRTRSAACRRAASTGSPSTTRARRSPAFVLRRHANRPATRSSGASDASGATSWTSRNLSMLNRSPVSTSDSANGSAASRIATTDPRNRSPTTDAALGFGQRADQLRGPDEVRLLGRCAGDPEHVDDEDRDEHRAVEQGQRALERQREAVQGRDHEERDLDRVRPFEHDVGGAQVDVRRQRLAGPCPGGRLGCGRPRRARPSTSRRRSAAGCRRSCWRARRARR